MSLLTRDAECVPTADSDFVALYQSLQRQGYRVALRILGDPMAAEDATAEGFARTYSRWAQVRDLPYREAWVIRVISNAALDVVRRGHAPLGPAPVGDDEDAAACRVAVVSALQGLSRRQQEVLVLHHLAGFPAKDVARTLGISPGTVKVHLRRGMAALRGGFGATS